MKPCTMRTLRVVYLFAGAPRRADMQECFRVLLKELNSACTSMQVHLEMLDVDILRGGAEHDLLNEDLRARLLKKIAEEVDMVIIAPPCDTYSRARHANFNGPQPLRDFT